MLDEQTDVQIGDEQVIGHVETRVRDGVVQQRDRSTALDALEAIEAGFSVTVATMRTFCTTPLG